MPPSALLLIVGIFIGLMLAALFLRTRLSQNQTSQSKLQDQLHRLTADHARMEERTSRSELELLRAHSELGQTRQALLETGQKYATEQQRARDLEERLSTQKAEWNESQARFKAEFENLANRILEEKSVKFTQQNQANLDQILKPFTERLADLRKTVESSHEADTRDRVTLHHQIKSLAELNQQMSLETNQLTHALKGQSQTQGAWGELILESVLERSGLTKGVEYLVQNSFTTEDQQRVRPDVVIQLPESKNLVIDSKLSLLAYERFCSATSESQRAVALKNHLESMTAHIKGLSDKKYQTLYQINSPDFVLMFVPIESAFSLAIQHDPELFNLAFERHIVLVTPTTLLATLRTVSNLWKLEKQNKNSLEIARKAGDLLDKFATFYASLENVSLRLNQTQSAHEEAMKQLRGGRGCLVNRAQEIQKLGVKSTKALPTPSDSDSESVES